MKEKIKGKESVIALSCTHETSNKSGICDECSIADDQMGYFTKDEDNKNI